MDVELVTNVEGLTRFVDSWDALACSLGLPRAKGTVVDAWARHMMPPGFELRVWVAREGEEVLGVLPLLAEAMPRGRFQLGPPATDMIFGVVPIADLKNADRVAMAVADHVATEADSLDLAVLYWLPAASPWRTALQRCFAEPEWVTIKGSPYNSFYVELDEGVDAWLETRGGEFRRTVRRRARRQEEQGFRAFTTVDPAEIMERLPQLQSLYLSRKENRGGEGYRFDDDMMRAIGTILRSRSRGQLRLSVIERDELLIGASLAVQAGQRMSCWLTGFDAEWSRLGPGIAALLEALDAGGRAGCTIADLGVGDEPYKDEFQDAAFPLESVTWCRPRLARLLQLRT
jgi:CelD/BcsL family acetyltransferase involved in cellulose biosynthesis